MIWQAINAGLDYFQREAGYALRSVPGSLPRVHLLEPLPAEHRIRPAVDHM